jgi:hypothetical protein
VLGEFEDLVSLLTGLSPTTKQQSEMQQLLNHNLAKIALVWVRFGVDQGLKLGKWAAPGAVFAGWMVWPALPASWKF